MKVPIIILKYTSSTGIEVEADLSVGTVFEQTPKGFTDRLVRRLLAQSPKALGIVRIVKLWAKVEKLNKAYDGYLNSLGWTLLVLAWLMIRGDIGLHCLYQEEADELGQGGDRTILPPSLHVDPDEAADEDENEEEKGTDDIIEDLGEAPTAEDLSEFFRWVAEWETWWPQADETSGPYGISLVDGEVTTVPKPPKVYHDTSLFFIEDPGVRLSTERSENVARALKKGTWATTVQRCLVAANSLAKEAAEEKDGSEVGGARESRWCTELKRGLEQLKEESTLPAAAPWRARQAPVGLLQRPPQAMVYPWQRNVLQQGHQAWNSNEPPWKRARNFVGGGKGGGKPGGSDTLCRWWQRGQCWDGDRCKLRHSM
mmetsp:Transcript_51301/g.109047  ORF Transcript_51301/g.109047 Transcript_51301/m.109047 type:complete len:371 (+) Transcript_51301:627-1739(+)